MSTIGGLDGLVYKFVERVDTCGAALEGYVSNPCMGLNKKMDVNTKRKEYVLL